MSDTFRTAAPSLWTTDDDSPLPPGPRSLWSAASSAAIGAPYLSARAGIPGEPTAFAEPMESEPAGARSTLVYGSDRKLVNRLVHLLAKASGARYQWIDLRVSVDRPALPDPRPSGCVPVERIQQLATTSALAPSPVPSEAAIDRLISQDESAELRFRFTAFLALPSAMQCALAALPSDGGPRLLAVTNADRVPTNETGTVMDSILEACGWAECPIIMGFVGTRPPPFAEFGRVFLVERTSGRGTPPIRVCRIRPDEYVATPASPVAPDLVCCETAIAVGVPA